MLRTLRFQTKIFLLLFGVTILAIVVNGFQSYVRIKAALQDEYLGKLRSIREEKKRQIESYFQQIHNQIIDFTENPVIVEAMREFKVTFQELAANEQADDPGLTTYTQALNEFYSKDYLQKMQEIKEDMPYSIEKYLPSEFPSIFLQYHYIVKNPYPQSRKDHLDSAGITPYHRVHAQYHPMMRNYLRRFGFYDIFLIDETTGNIVYTVYKEVDFATNLITGPYQDSNLARAFQAASTASHAGYVKFVDFTPYAPSYMAPAAFVASPIYANGQKIGVVVFQLSIDTINRIMTGNFQWKQDGLGHTSGETYIVGDDFTMRNDARLFIEAPEHYFATLQRLGMEPQSIRRMRAHKTSILFQPIHTVATEHALQGYTDARLLQDYRHIPVLSAYAPLQIPDLQWAIVAEIDAAEIFAPFYGLQRGMLLTALGIAMVVLILALAVVKRTVAPIHQLTSGMQAFGQGDLGQRVTLASTDEIGQLASAFNQMATSIEHHTTALQRAEARFRHLLEAAPNAMIISDHHGHIVLVNEQTERAFGYSREELYGQSIELLVPERFWSAHVTSRTQYYNDPQVRHMRADREVPGRRKDGQEFPAEVRLNPLETEDGLLVISAIRDVTAYKEAEEALQKARQEAEEANHMKSSFLANMSHEIRTPMNAILGFTDLLKTQVTESKAQTYLDAIAVSGRSLLTLINDILDLSKIEAGKLTLEYAPFSLRQLCMEIQHVFVQKAEAKGLGLSITIDPTLPEGLVLDEVRLRQILFNVIGNALKFTHEGKVSLTATGQYRPDDVDTLDLILEINDSGIGIAPDQLQGIFDAFVQARGQSTRLYGGTGLGLSITKRLTEMMHGTVEVDSRAGQGSTFRFVFREVRIAELALRAHNDEEMQALPNLGPSTILIADDIDLNRVLLQGYFDGTPHTLLFAANGLEALQMTQDQRPDVILMDIHMPVMDGVTAIHKIREIEPLATIPIIALTASSMRNERETIAKVCDRYLSKPISKAALFKVLAEFLPVLQNEPSAIAKSPSEASSEATADNAGTTTPTTLNGQWTAALETLCQQEMTVWEELCATLNMSALEAFTQRLLLCAQHHQITPLLRYAQELLRQVEAFDVEHLPQTLQAFPQLFDTLTE